MKNPLSFHLIAIALVILSALGVFYSSRSTPQFHNNLCKAAVNFKLASDSQGYGYHLFLRLNFTDTGKGYEHVRGEVYRSGHTYTVARTLNLSYHARNAKVNYEVRVDDVIKTGQDNLPDAVATQYLSYMLPKSLVFLRIDEINRHLMLISGPQGPVLVCSLR